MAELSIDMIKIMWLSAAVVFGVAEIFTASLTLIWFSFGAIIAMVASSYVESIVVQIIIFGVTSTIMLIIATKCIIKKDKTYVSNTNIDAIVGKKATIKALTGKMIYGIAVLDGEEWSAAAEEDELIEPGTVVEVVRIEGVKLIVRRCKDDTEKDNDKQE